MDAILATRGAPLRAPAFLALLLALTSFVGCSTGATPGSAPPEEPSATAAEPSASSPEFPLTITDDDGTAVTIPAEPRRIVSLTPAATETLFAVGAGDRVVGKVEDVANFPPAAANVPVVGTFADVDIERIVDLEADLVIAGGNGGTPPEAIERLRSLGVPVVVIYAADVDGVFRDIELTGEVAGARDAARDLTASMRAGFDQVAAATAALDKPRVFYETGDQPAVYGVADESFITSMLELAGAEPVTTGSTTSWEMSIERLVERDPEIILLGDAAYGVTPEAVASRPGWGGLTAVERKAIAPIDDIIVTRPGPRLLDGLLALVAAVHPEAALPSGLPTTAPAAS